MPNGKIISPIAIDLGAKNTGVYFAHYPAGSSLDVFKEKGTKAGKVYTLDKNSYTYLMVDRTAKRHQRRGYKRRRMAKRLFKLVWCEHLKLPWDEDIQQTISFLMNRRGFSFLTEEYDADILRQFPKEAHEELPDELKIEPDENGNYDFDSAITEWTQEKSEDFIKEKYQAITKQPKSIRHQLSVIGKTKKLHKYCGIRIEGEQIDENKKRPALGKLSKWVLDEWKSAGIQGLETVEVQRGQVNMVEFLNGQSSEQVEIIRSSIKLGDSDTKTKELEKSVWNFKEGDFQQDKADFGADDEPDIRTHLHHLAFALYKTHEELQSGGRHRSKYFEEIKEVLETKNHTHNYLKNFCKTLQSGKFKGLTVQSLANLIGHISNLELKPLRKYFNKPAYKKGDKLDKKHITKLFHRWILREWRVGEKDKQKIGDGKWLYSKLKEKWNQHDGSAIDFWLKTDPNYTIPPYQDNNNRRPPKCQSLILNVKFLDKKYSEWQNWLDELKNLKEVKEYLGNYENELRDQKSSKSPSYFFKDKDYEDDLKKDSGRRSMQELNARTLQFIFDRVKAEDPLNLNEIYSHTKKYQQTQSTDTEKQNAKKNLEQALKDSNLPDKLITKRNYQNEAIFAEGTFLHLVCKYYKQRQRARDGRIYIHPKYHFIKGRGYENTGRFDDKDHLLTYCNHKPRQKRYQMLGNLTGSLQVSSQELQKLTSKYEGKNVDDKLFNWLGSIPHLKANCDRAAKEQKERRGRLKLDIQSVFGLIYHKKKSESPTAREIKAILEKSRVNNAFKLHSFCNRAKDLCLSLTKSLYDNSKQEQWRKELDKNPASAVYLLAQVNNIAFKERSGNANTCAVCSTDNARRMQLVPAANGKDTTAQAQRLPAIFTRIIDGAVMRMARIVGGAIAEDKWSKIKNELEAGNKVCVPIITESNRFAFEPDLKTLKGKPLREKDKNYQQSDLLTDKEERIKAASQGICPYTGDSLSSGDIDHIIPRSGEWGTLNDEANLIGASDRGNKEIKQEQTFTLRELADAYKNKQFNTTNDGEITNWIVEQIGDGSGEDFKFGKYRNFINLEPDEQKAFRHALFLVGYPVRNQVIDAINNRNRALVNGTQRYFAEVLANSLYKKSKELSEKLHRKNLEQNLSFDYFGVEAWDTSRGNGIKDFRKELVENYRQDLKEFDKADGAPQTTYSHLLDAQIAFCMALEAHQKEGTLNLDLQGNGMWSRTNKETGKVVSKAKCKIHDASLFNAIQVPEIEINKTGALVREKPNEKFSSHRSFTRDTYYADRYLPILIRREGDSISVKVGFDWNNSVSIKADTKTKSKELVTNLIQLLPFCNETKSLLDDQYVDLNSLFASMEKIGYFARQLQNNSYCYLTVNKLKLHEHWRKKYNTKGGIQFEHETFAYKSLFYKTEKKTISKPDDLSETIRELDKHFALKVGNDKIILPARKQWQDCFNAWQIAETKGTEFTQFLRNYFIIKSDAATTHKKARKDFSLPILTSQGKFMLRRKSWTGDYIYQIINDSDSRNPDNKPNVPIRKEDNSRGIKLAKWAESDNFVKFSKDRYERGEHIDPSKWYLVDKNVELPNEIDRLWYRIDDSTAPSIAIRLANDGNKMNAGFMNKAVCQHGFRKQKRKEAKGNTPAQPEKSSDDVRDEFFKREIRQAKKGTIHEYKGSSYNKEMDGAFRTAKIVDKLY